MSDTVLVTGALGLVGAQTVRRLTEQGRRVVATDLDTPANRRAARKLPDSVEVRWADLTDPEQVQRLIAGTAPASVVHLAAVIAPAIYAIPATARRVNVDATGHLVRAAEEQPSPPRFVHISSVTVMGPRNPHRTAPPLTADQTMRPFDIYSGQKAEGEEIVRGSTLEWVVLRLGRCSAPT
jgi:nucleoside-diphosphate-sugar epimerase